MGFFGCKNKHALLSFLLILAEIFSTSSVSGAVPLEFDLKGVNSKYTAPLLQRAKLFLSRGFVKVSPDLGDLSVQCLETPNEPLYIGVAQSMTIRAPFDRVIAVLDDVNQYKDLFPGYDDVHLISQNGNLLYTYWEQHIPMLFVPNVKYEMNYVMDTTLPGKKVYRYQLAKPTKLTTSDGIILVERAGEDRTNYEEFDFFDAEWGIAKALGHEKLWRDSVEGIYLSDLALKLKAEDSSLKSSEALKLAGDKRDRKIVRGCYDQRKVLSHPTLLVELNPWQTTRGESK